MKFKTSGGPLVYGYRSIARTLRKEPVKPGFHHGQKDTEADGNPTSSWLPTKIIARLIFIFPHNNFIGVQVYEAVKVIPR